MLQAAIAEAVCMAVAESWLWLWLQQLTERQEVGHQLGPIGAADALRMELHAIAGQAAVRNAHRNVLHARYV